MIWTKIIDARLNKYGFIDSNFIKQNKVPSKCISRMVLSQKIFKIKKGIYALSPYFEYDEYSYISNKKSKVVFSGFSALLLLGQTEFMPAKIEVTVPSNYCIQKDNLLDITYQKPELWKEGIIEVVRSNNIKVKCYSYERVIIDFIRKDMMNEEFVFKAIGNYYNYENKNENELFRLAKIFNVESEVDKILNIMQYTKKAN